MRCSEFRLDALIIPDKVIAFNKGSRDQGFKDPSEMVGNYKALKI